MPVSSACWRIRLDYTLSATLAAKLLIRHQFVAALPALWSRRGRLTRMRICPGGCCELLLRQRRQVRLELFNCGQHRGSFRGHRLLQCQLGIPANRFGHQPAHQPTSVDVRFTETVNLVEVDFQRAHNVAVVIDRHSDQRKNSALAARFGVEQYLGIYVLTASHLSGAHAGGTNRRSQGYFALQGQSRRSCCGAITHHLLL